MDRTAAVLFALSGVPAALFMPFLLAWIFVNDSLPVMSGVRVMSGGPFEQLGPRAMAILGIPFIATSVLEIIVARRLWRGDRRGRTLGLALLAPTELFAVGYDLPLWHGLVALRTAAVAAAIVGARRTPGLRSP